MGHVLLMRTIAMAKTVCERMQGPGRRPVWHDSYTIDGIPIEQPLTLTITAYDVSDDGNFPIGAQPLLMFSHLKKSYSSCVEA